MKHSDMLAWEWKYVPLSRMALFVERSIRCGTQWVILEPNDASTWDKV